MKPRCCKNKKLIADLSQTVKFLKVIGEENRLKILCILRNGETCVCNIWKYLGLSQNLTSHHLKVLKDFKLVNSNKKGLKVLYSLNQRVVKRYCKLLDNFLGRII